MSEVIPDVPAEYTEFVFNFTPPAPWLLKITKEGRIIFNHEAYPDMMPDEFAKQFVRIVESYLGARWAE